MATRITPLSRPTSGLNDPRSTRAKPIYRPADILGLKGTRAG